MLLDDAERGVRVSYNEVLIDKEQPILLQETNHHKQPFSLVFRP